MDKNGDNLELQTLLNEKQEEQFNDGGKQKKSSSVNGKGFLKGIIAARFCSVFSRSRGHSG